MTSAPDRAAAIASIIPAPPPDVTPLRSAFSRMVSRQFETHVSVAAVSRKSRFIAEMYARACYSMLLVRHASTIPPLPRALIVRSAGAAFAGVEWLVPRSLHRHLMLTSTLMGMLDVVLDDSASSGEPAVLRIASLIANPSPAGLSPAEQSIAALAQTLRRHETPLQSAYWETTLQPAVRDYCQAEALAVAHAPDPTGMGHRSAGIDAALKGMWYVVGQYVGSRERQWMADTSLLMQIIDDWVDQDEDRGARLTPVLAGAWSLQSVEDLHRKTVRDLASMLSANRLSNPVLRQLFLDLYNDYLHVALQAMRSGVAA